MQISLTKKLATAMGMKPGPATDTNPLFSWTANWTNTFDRRKEDMIVMVNNATRFTVTIYGVKRNGFADIATKMHNAVRNTLLAMNLNPEIVDEYIDSADDIVFAANNDPKRTSWVNRQGFCASFTVGRAVNESYGGLKYEDTLGYIVSQDSVNYGKSFKDSYVPADEMIKALTALTGKPTYKYCAFELLVTLDLDIYKATRRLIVPADIDFYRFHKLLQRVFDWGNRHLHDFVILDNKTLKPIARLVASKQELTYDHEAVVETGHKLSEYFPKHTKMIYTYDMGDNWEHVIELVRVIDEHNDESPYLLEAVGKTPPDDVGGVGNFIDFREIMLNPNHPDYARTKEWVGYWSPELREWDTKPKVIRFLS